MFKENKEHEQGQMFNEEDRMHPRLKKRLQKHWSGIFYEKVFCNIDEEIFKSLYCEHFGRGNFPVNILVGLEIIKEMFSLTDEQLLDRYNFDLSIRRALGLKDINEHILAPRTYYYFRSAVAQYEFEHGVDLYGNVFTDDRDRVIKELRIRTGLQRTDSTMIGANIKRMSRLMLFHKVLSNIVKDLLRLSFKVPANIKEIVEDDEDGFTYRLKKEDVLSKTREIGEYIYSLITKHSLDSDLNELKSFKDAERLLREQCNVKGNKITLKEPKDIDSSSMQNPSDSDATYRKKRNKEHRGYAAHATETCDKENSIQVITDVGVVKNNVDDAEVLSNKLKKLKEETDIETIIADGAFVSDDVRDECKENDVQLVTSAIRGRLSKKDLEEKLTSKDFDIDEDTGKMNCCPEGVAPRIQKVTEKSLIANFDPKICMECKKKNICPAFRSHKLSRIVIDDKRKWLDERHELMKTKGYRELCNLRPPVEGLMEKLKPKYLNGRTLFRGLKKVKNRMILRAIGINFRRYAAYKLDSLAYTLSKLYILAKNCFLWSKVSFH